ncbi:hypothetical protein GPECTOR_8g337 [Gonium pectorale]|uniref:Uncharacterized protein n=1 Tax=Gonium pectorale TaxID=33097 RepID=A0A150GT54_GONPE|nr:hypothetical protein GPECTOR_8g337 [Gonium pectorale]|eukprot:KXZ52964.1 hypothetical protein GPECTOR_8g337 [Gonium pectorale]
MSSGSSGWATRSGATLRHHRALAAAAAQAPQRPRPPRYRPVVRLRTELVKLSDYEPEQLGPGWEERLRAELEARGLIMARAYVRAGCIELLLELSQLADPTRGGSSDNGVGSGRDGFGSGRLVLDLTATGLPHVALPGQEAGGVGAEAGSLLEVLVRLRDRYLPARVRAQAAAVPGGGNDEDGPGEGSERSGRAAVRFEVELEAEGLQPGLAQVDLRLGGRPLCTLPLLLLSAGREDLAAELATMAEEEGEVRDSDDECQDSMSELLYDLGVLLFCSARAADAMVKDLALNLLGYAEGHGLVAVAAAVRDAMEARRPTAETAHEGAGVGSCSVSSSGAGGAISPLPQPPQPCLPVIETAWRDVVRALLLSLGLVREGPAETKAFRAAAAQAHAARRVEPSWILIWVLRTAVGLVTGVAWLLLPPHRWLRLATAARVPRHVSSVLAKALAVGLGVRLPPVMSSFHTGVGLVVAEGLILPTTCPLSVRSLLLISALRLPLNAVLMGSGPGSEGGAAGRLGSPGGWPLTGRALLLAARVEVVALATTLACNVYLRLGCRRGRRLQPQGPQHKGVKAA